MLVESPESLRPTFRFCWFTWGVSSTWNEDGFRFFEQKRNLKPAEEPKQHKQQLTLRKGEVALNRA